MKQLLITLLFAGLGVAQTSSQQHANTEKSGQKAGEPTAIFETTAGNITCTLFPDKAPLGVANFIGLATGTKEWKDPKTGKMMKGVPLYNGTIFHRVIPDFMIQGGDPAGSGSGDVGFQFKNETTSELKFDRPGRLAYANAGPDTNGSQFFITEAAYPSLNGGYTIFGQCQDLDVVNKIARMPRNGQDRPNSPVKITHIKISQPGQSAAASEPKSAATHSTAKTSSAAKPQQ